MLNLDLKKVAVTGGLASGKSSVCHILKNNGAYVVSADEVVHQLLNSNTLNQEIIKQLGSEVVSEGKLDRSKIARLVFENSEKLAKLEAILHPIVIDEIKKSYEKVKNEKKYVLFVAEIPLLFEIKAQGYFDYVIAVVGMQRPLSQDDEKRIARQMPQEEKAARADYVITNDGTLEELEDKTLKILRKINARRK